MSTQRRFVRTFEEWREAARPLLANGIHPDEIEWLQSAGPPSLTAPLDALPGRFEIKLPRRLVQLLEYVALYRHPSRWHLMYRLAYRTLDQSPQLLSDEADPDLREANRMFNCVTREIHKFHAFIRFRETRPATGAPTYFAWFEPEHEVLRKAAPFFAKRFPNMPWTIATPDGAAVCDNGKLSFIETRATGPQTGSDSHDPLWRTYYRSICNVARINSKVMQREMPQRYWRHLPEATEIPVLIRDGLEKFAQRHSEADDNRLRMAKAVQRSLAELPALTEGPAACKRCDLWRHATQAVSGEGPEHAAIMLLGEQPGDEEDLRGRAFVGPAGKVLDDAIVAAGLERPDLFVTNAVKHFKWEPRGKRRLHKRPDVSEITACNVWLNREIANVKPRVIVALGATALRALTGVSDSIESAREQALRHPSGAHVVCTYHPAAILRAADGKAEMLRERLVEDLQRAARIVLLDPAFRVESGERHAGETNPRESEARQAPGQVSVDAGR